MFEIQAPEEMPPGAYDRLLAGGWFRMGDLFVRNPDASYDFVDRAKFMIKSGGENIYPAEIEACLLRHPAVAEAAVFGIPDPVWGETVAACLRFVSDSEPPLARELKDHCRVLLSPQKTCSTHLHALWAIFHPRWEFQPLLKNRPR